MIEKDYQKLLAAEKQRTADIEDSMNRKYTDMLDYYSMWVHQIKTPIASMRLALQEDDSDSTDYVFREYSLDSMIRQAVRKFSSSFIQKKIRLHYEGTQAAVVTDEKWLLFVIEQVLSNGLKYTRQQGCITIEVKEPQLLCIRDTGIGIARRIFPGFLIRDIPDIMEERIRKQAESVCICAGESAEILDIRSGLLPVWEKELWFILT